MKKAALIIGSLFAVFALGACEADEQEDLSEQIEALEEQIETIHTEVVERDETIESLEEEIAILKDSLYEGSVTFSLDSEDEMHSETIHFSTDEEGTLKLLEAAFSIDFTESDFGVFLESVGPIDPVPGSYIALYKNGEMADVGIGDIEYEDGDHFHFAMEFFDESAEVIHEGLTALEGNFESLKDDSTLDHTLFFGLQHLGALQPDDATIDPDEAESSGDLINAIFTQRALDADTLEYEEALLEQADTDWLYPASLQVLALQDESLDLEHFHNEYIDNIDGDTLDEHDEDSLAMAYFALDSLGEDDLREQIVLLMEEAPSEYPYSDNAASHAHRVMVLAHANELEVAHVQSLVNYQLESGMFAYEIDDDTPDTAFSTPQALLALAYAQQTIDGFDGHPFETDGPIEQD